MKGLCSSPSLFWVISAGNLFIKFRIESIKVPAVQFFLYNTQTFAKTLIVYDFPLPEKTDRLTHFRIFYKAENIVVGSTRLLFCCNCERTTYHVEQIGQAAFTHTKTEY